MPEERKGIIYHMMRMANPHNLYDQFNYKIINILIINDS